MAKFCRNCGSSVTEGERFCQNCGQPIEQPAKKTPKCVQCGADLNETSKFCPACGKTVGDAKQDTAPIKNIVPKVQNETIAQMNQKAAERGIHIATPKDQRVAPPPQPSTKKRKGPLAAVAVMLAATILFTGLVAPGWMKSSNKAKITPIYDDNSYVKLTLPDLNKETDCTLSVANMAIQAQENAMLTEERFYRAVDQGKSISELTELLEQNKKAWETADILSSATYMMSTALDKAEKTKNYKFTSALINPVLTANDPFALSASAKDVLHMDRFDNAKQWAEYITEIVDHAKGNKTAYLAKLLKTDVKRADLAISQAQAILGGASEAQAHNDSATLTALQTTKATGKVAGFVAVTIASGGTSMGVLSAGGYVAGGVDTFIEVTDTTMKLTLGEDHACTKMFEEQSGKLAPILSLATLVNVPTPDTFADKISNLRYIADTIVDLKDGKVFGFDFSSKPENGEKSNEIKIINMNVGKDATPEDKEKLVKALTDMGFDKKAVEEAIEPAPDGQQPQNTEKSFDEISDEQLEKLIDDTSLENVDWETIFKELYEEFIEVMADKEFLIDDDDLWDYEPLIPPEELPQPGDEIGFEEILGEHKEPTEDEGEPAQPGDEIGFEDSSKSKNNVADDNKDDDDPLQKYNGKYLGTATITKYYQGDESSTVQEGVDSAMVTITNDDIVKPWNFGHGQNFDKGSIKWNTSTASGSATANDGKYDVSWHFEEKGKTIKLFIDVYESKPANVINMNSKYLSEAHLELVKEGTEDEDLEKYKGVYEGTFTTTYTSEGKTQVISKDKTANVYLKDTIDDKVPKPWYVCEATYSIDSLEWSTPKASGSVTVPHEDGDYYISWHFEESGKTITLIMDVNFPETAKRTFTKTLHYEMVKKGTEDDEAENKKRLKEYEGYYAGTCDITAKGKTKHYEGSEGDVADVEIKQTDDEKWLLLPRINGGFDFDLKSVKWNSSTMSGSASDSSGKTTYSWRFEGSAENPTLIFDKVESNTNSGDIKYHSVLKRSTRQ